MSLYVGNLPPDCNDAVLYRKFSLVGKVSSVKVCRDSTTANSLGYGYVNFSDPDDAKTAIDTMNYDLLFGKAIRIMWAQKNPNKLPAAANLFVKNLDPRENELTLKDVFSPFGDILSIKVAKTSRGDSKGYGFVQFSEEQAADKAISVMDNTELDGRVISVSRYIPVEERRRYQQSTYPNNIYICNLTTTTSEELVKICEAFGEVVSGKIVTDSNNRSKGFGFVSFKERESAEKAVLELNRLCLNCKIVSASFVKTKQTLKL